MLSIDPVLGFRLPPPPDAEPLVRLLYAQEQVINRRQARYHLSDKALRHRLETGRWQIAHPGIHLAHSGPVTRDQKRWVAVLAAGAGRRAVLGGLSALEMRGMRGFVSEEFHLIIPTQRRDRNPAPGVIVHRTRALAAADIDRAATPPCTMPARSVIDAAQWARTDDRARTIVAAAFQQGLVTGTQIDAALGRLAKVRRRSLIASTAADAQQGSHSVSEVDFLRICRNGRLPEPSRQVLRTDARGGRRYLDVLFEEWQVHVEIDGGQHMEARQWWDDMRRQNDLWVSGVRILRFPAWVVRERPRDVVAQVRAALIAAGWRPPT